MNDSFAEGDEHYQRQMLLAFSKRLPHCRIAPYLAILARLLCWSPLATKFEFSHSF